MSKENMVWAVGGAAAVGVVAYLLLRGDDAAVPAAGTTPIAPPATTNRERLFGTFAYRPAPTRTNPEAIQVLDDWVSKNLVQVMVPQLIGVAGAPSDGRVPFHRAVAAQLQGLFRAWEAAGLLPEVLSWNGSYSPRFIRGSKTTLSNHAWGAAFDINAQWNPLGQTPATTGSKGAVRDLVAIANQYGFSWGGNFNGRPDGMHFEANKILPVA